MPYTFIHVNMQLWIYLLSEVKQATLHIYTISSAAGPNHFDYGATVGVADTCVLMLTIICGSIIRFT